ncbi:MAG: hypothetical protein CR997_07005 [Acidobacteria bacterium]|nr:MAG: hypothetical protein CR997_07005 [Acidobacteriota bacterium]
MVNCAYVFSSWSSIVLVTISKPEQVFVPNDGIESEGRYLNMVFIQLLIFSRPRVFFRTNIFFKFIVELRLHLHSPLSYHVNWE